MNETTIPLLHCLVDPDEMIAFYRCLGFEVTWDQRRPYLYLALQRGDIHVHFGSGPTTLDPSLETTGGALVMVDELEPYHRAFTSGLRAVHGKVLSSGRPRLTRLRPGQSRFSVIDPSGNTIIFIRRDEPEDVDYGGAADLEGLDRVLDNASVLREFKLDDRAAARVLDVGIRRFGDDATQVQLARAWAARGELGAALGDEEVVRAARAALAGMQLTDDERTLISDELAAADRLHAWINDRQQ